MEARAQGLRLARVLLVVAWLAAPAAEAASRFYRDDEIAQAHALRSRVMDRVPGLAEAVGPAAKGPLEAGAAANLLQALKALGQGEADNPFYFWALGEVRRRAGDAGAAADFARATAATKGQPLIHWLLWESYLDRGQLQEADAELSTLQEVYQGWGLQQLPHLAERLVQGARLALARGSFQEAAILLERSMESDPSQAAPHFVMARLLWQRDKRNVPLALRFLADGFALAWRSRETRQLVLGNLLGDLIRTFALGLVTLSAVAFLRCYRLAMHDARHRFRQHLTPAGQVGVLVAVLLPFALGLGLFWTGVLILILCAPYLSGRDRLAVSIMLLLVTLLPPAYREVARDNLTAGSPRAILVEEVEAGARGEETVAQVREWASESPESYVPAYFLGLVQRRRGELSAAAQALRRATVLAAGRPAPSVALGNVRYLQGDKDGALETYAKAGAPPAGSALAHRNMAFVHLERLEFERARQELEEAFRLDPRLPSAVSSPRSGRAGAFLADERLGEADLREALMPSPPQEEALAAAILAGTLGRVPLGALPIAGGISLLAFWGMVHWGPQAAQARACARCGKVFCPRCQTAMPAERLCAACGAVRHLRQGIGAPLMVQRRPDVEAFQERRQRLVGILALCLPGSGHLFLGRPLGGFVLLLPALFLLSQVLVGTLFWRPLPLPPEMSALLGPATAVPLFLILSGLSAWRCRRFTAAEED